MKELLGIYKKLPDNARLTANEIAEALGLNPNCLKSRIRRGTFPEPDSVGNKMNRVKGRHGKVHYWTVKTIKKYAQEHNDET